MRGSRQQGKVCFQSFVDLGEASRTNRQHFVSAFKELGTYSGSRPRQANSQATEDHGKDLKGEFFGSRRFFGMNELGWFSGSRLEQARFRESDDWGRV